MRKTLQIFGVGAALFFLPTSIKTQWNNYLPCDGQIAWAELASTAHASNFIFNSSFTVEGWLYFNQADAPATLIAVRDNDEAPLYRVGKQNGRQFYFDLTDVHGKTWRVVADEDIPTGQWIHVAAVFQEAQDDLEVMALYVNGTRKGLLRAQIELASQAQYRHQQPVLRLAGESESEIFSGRLDEVRVSSCPRYTLPVISGLDNTFSVDSATIALWHFDEPFGSATLADATGGGFDLSLAKSSTVWPMSLNDFTVSAFGTGSLLLSWKTRNELDLFGIEVQRRNALENFECVGFLPAHGVVLKKFSYDFTDMPEASGRYYYRLKMLNSTGHYRFSPEVGVDFAANVK